MSLETVEKFWEWFHQQRGSTSTRQVEEDAHVPRGRIGNAASSNQQPTMVVCQAIATGLGIPEEQVLMRAGLLTPAHVDDRDPTIREVIDYMKRLTPEERQTIREFAEFRYQVQTRGGS